VSVTTEVRTRCAGRRAAVALVDSLAPVKTRLASLLALVLLSLPAAPAQASHYAKARAGKGPLTEGEARREVRRVLRQRGFDGSVTTGLKQSCRRLSRRRVGCRFSRGFVGGVLALRGKGSVYLSSLSRGALLRYRLDTTVTYAEPCEASQTGACVERFYFTQANHLRVDGSAGCGSPVTAGTTTETLVVNGVQRTYLKVVSTGLDPDVSAPIVMGFHGGNDTAANANAYMGLTSSDAVLYIYPQGARFADAWAGWNVDPAGADFPFVDALLADLKDKHCVNAKRVFATGKSNGGFFVNSLLCQRPASFRAAASVAGGGPQYDCTQPRAFMGIHGTADRPVPISTGRRSRDYWLARNRYANAAPVPVNASPCVSYPAPPNSVVWCEHGGGHDWPAWAGAAIRSFFGLS
jgi:polyhydroxybutyrate depolymerase